MLQWWDRIPIPGSGGSVDPKTLIAEWFYQAPSPGQYYSGDWSMDADFEAHVRCILMDPGTGIAQVDCRMISPVSDHYFLFYSLERGHLVLWGGLTYGDLMTLQPPGVVRCNEDLLWQPSNKTRRRGNAISITVTTVVSDFKKEDWKPFCWHFPLPECAAAIAADPEAKELTGEVFDVALNRMEWFYDTGNPIAFPDGPLELASFLLCASVSHALLGAGGIGREESLDYQMLRMAREQQLFNHRIGPFLASEKAMLFLLRHNDAFWKKRVICNVVTPDPEDVQAFCRIAGLETEVPTCWIRVPVWEFPYQEAAWEFPLHEGGILHMPCYPPWLATWIWQSHVLPEAQRHFTRAAPLTLGPDDGPFAEFFREAVSYVPVLKERNEKAKRKESKFKSSGGGEFAPEVPIIGDMEDLFRAAPPCVTALLTQRRFPINMERFRLTRILMGAGVSMDTMVKLYERLNDQHIRDKPQTLKQRFDVEGTAKWWGKKDPVWCTSLINTTLQGLDGGNMGCPLVRREVQVLGPPPSPKADELTLAKYSYQVRQRCTACHTPGRPEHWKPWSTPEQAMREAYKSKGNL